MIAMYVGETKGFPQHETVYVIDISNGGVGGEIIVSIPIKDRESAPIWSKKYEDWSDVIDDWEETSL